MMLLNKKFLSITAGLVVLMLFISSSVATNKHCDTVIKAHHYTKTIYPSHCPRRSTTTTTTTSTTTATATATITTTTTTTTDTTTTTTSTSTTFVPPTPVLKKRHL